VLFITRVQAEEGLGEDRPCLSVLQQEFPLHVLVDSSRAETQRQ
jgi:hypothetical protein